MRNSLFAYLLLLSLPAFAQTAPYQAFEADSAAEPRGGMAFLNTFIQTSLRKPIPAEAAGIGGLVIVGGVVETDGRVSGVNVMRSLRPDCDREATRVFRLFNAWKPAQKDGKAVRQLISIPITFKPNKPFTYVNGDKVSYFDADNKLASDSSQARYRQVAPMDTNGLPAGDIVVYKRKGTGWKEDFRLPLIRRQNPYQGSRTKSVQLVGYQNGNQQWEGQVFTMDDAGTLIHQEYYQNGKKSGPELFYHKNGSIAEKADDFEDKQVSTSWYPTGQIKRMRTVTKVKALPPVTTPELVAAVWDSTGNQTVKDGNGWTTYQQMTTSRADTATKTQLIEHGMYKDGFRQGIWTGRYADGSYFYEEQYDKGVCTAGKARSSGADTVRYTDGGHAPEFAGGMQGLGQFLAQNLRYPAEAQRARVQGQVFISFVVCTDGSLCDYEVIKSVDPTVDQEALRVVKAMSGRWKPGVQRGEKVRVKYNLPINFTLQ